METRRRLVVTAAVVGTFLASVDVTVVGTAMPTIVSQLGGLALFPWVFSIYLLTSTVTVPLYGKGADLFGRKPMYLIGIGLFLTGSLLCASASTMEQLVLWRAVQGMGAGGVTPVTLTIVGDLYPAAQRARIQGLFSAVWAVSSIAGPALGALIVEQWAWQWIFLLNLPFGVVAAGLMMLALHERIDRQRHRLDLLGAALLSIGTTCFMWAMLRVGDDGFTPTVAATLAVAVVAILGLVMQERRHPEPMIPPELLANRVVAVTAIAGVLLGVVLFGTTSYVPAFVQGALGGGPTDAGAAVIPMGIGWPLASNLNGWTLRRWGYRPCAVLGGGLLVVGGAGLVALDGGSGRPLIMGTMFVIGLGMGFSSTTLLIAAQEVVPWNRRGAVTGLVQFARTIGGAVGVAAMGAVLTATLHAELRDPKLIEAANQVMNPHQRGAVPADVAAHVRDALGLGLGHVLAGVGIAAFVSLAAIIAFPRDLAVRGGRED